MDQTAAPLFASDDSARVVEMIAVTRDITEQRRAEADLLQVRLAQELASSATRHIGSLGVRLKTPLQAMIGYTEILLEGAHEQGRERDAQDAQPVLNAAEELSSLFNIILRTTLAETRKPTPANDVDDLLEAAVATVQTLAEANGTQIKIEVDPRCVSLPADEEMLSQSLQALLSYAAGSTRNGVITVRARPVLVNGSPRLVFSVTDTSEGLSPEQLKSLFEASSNENGAAGGGHAAALSGLIAACKLAAFMGGDFKATSALGRGSRFALEVPTRQPDAQRERAQAIPR